LLSRLSILQHSTPPTGVSLRSAMAPVGIFTVIGDSGWDLYCNSSIDTACFPCDHEDMAAVAGARGGLKAHQDSIRLSEAELVRDLRDILGAKLVAYIGSVKETRAVRQWADGERKPSAEVMTRLRHAYHVAALLAERDSRTVVQAWFQGMNPQLDDVPPARLLREGQVEDAAQAVLAAARAFAAAG
jgi:hypothetical protein